MSALDGPPLVAVEVGPCRCSGSPHDPDIVYLHGEATPEIGLAAYGAIAAAEGVEDQRVRLGMAYLVHGVADWTFVDDGGSPIPVTPDTIRRALPWGRGGREVAEKANELYSDEVVRPLVERAQRSSRVTSITASTSVSRPSSSARRKRSA